MPKNQLFTKRQTTLIQKFGVDLQLQQYLEQGMDSIVTKYQSLIEKIFKQAIYHSKYSDEPEKTILEVYNEKGRKQILQINNNLKIVMDNDFAKAIIKIAHNYSKIYISDFKKLEVNIIFLGFLARIVQSSKFITRREKIKIDDALNKIKNSNQYRLNSKITLLLSSDDKQEFRGDFFKALNYEQFDIEDDQKSAQNYQKFYKDSLQNLDRKLFVKIDSIISKFENRQEILGDILDKVDSYFGQEIGKDDAELQINQFFMQTAESQRLQSNQQHLEMLEEQFLQIKKMLDKFSGRKMFTEKLKLELRLAKFGSIISGFATRNTDMDLTILTNCYIDEVLFLQYLQEFLEVEFKNKKNIQCKIDFIKSARVPLLKLMIKTNRGKTSVDLIVNNILGVINSRFLSVYGAVRWVRQLGLLVKIWAKSHDLIKQSMFSSYSFNLLLIHFLIQSGRVNLIMDGRYRKLQTTPHFIYKKKNQGVNQQFPVYVNFKQNPDDVTSLKRVNIYQVLRQFFCYFSTNGKHWKMPQQESIITVDGSKQKQFDKQYIFTMKDPFDLTHNPGRVTIGSKTKLLRLVDQALQILDRRNLKEIEKMFF